MLAKTIVKQLDIDPLALYVEPFVGGGAIFSQVAPSRSWLNDADKSLMMLYRACRDRPEQLIDRIRRYRPSVQGWLHAKQYDGKEQEIIEGAMNKLVLNQCSHGGLGYKAGGPQGGLQQRSKYKIDCRWAPEHIVKKIRRFHDLLKNSRLTAMDALQMDIPDDSFVFCDPPYIAAGPALYRHETCHQQLADKLSKAKYRWAVTYDDHDQVHELYADYQISFVDNKSGNNPGNKREVLIKNPPQAIKG